MTKKLASLLAILLAFSLIAAACGDDDTDDADVTGQDDGGDDSGDDGGDDGDDGGDDSTVTDDPTCNGTVSYGIVEPSWIDSFNTQDSEGFEVARLLFDGLTDYGEDLSPVPAVATDWSSNDDKTEWTFNLRDDVTFHDGTPVTAQSFIDGFNRVANPDNLSDVSYHGSYVAKVTGWDTVEAGEATEIAGLAAPDETTLVISLDAPNPIIPKIMAHPVFSPVNMAAVEAGGDGYTDAPVGNGPYQMDGSWQHDVSIKLVQNEAYHGTPGKPCGVDFNIYDSSETMYLEAQAGNLDISEVPPENITTASDDFGGNYIDVETGSFTYLGFPNDTPPFDNVDIRRALSLAIDRETIMEEIFAGTRAPATGFVPPLAPGAIGECANATYDPELAKELFDGAGGIEGNSVTIYFNTGGGHEEWTQAVANGWLQTLGIEAEFVGQEFSPYLDVLQSDEGVDGPFRLGWGWDAPSASNFLGPLYGSESTDNYTGYANDAFDAAMVEFNSAPTEEDGFPALATAQEILCEDVPVAPIYFGRGQKVYTDNVSNVIYSVFGFTLLEQVEVAS
ncbi:MAG: ABC transporter substrate-binding protein [Acidimicrobiales bacterium]|nr:ABC transporter substrate-binding protein [Acidimicrobiales bacterium]